MKELYILAVKLKFCPQNRSIGWKEDPYLWMCELQRWLREVHKIHLSVVYSADHNKFSVNGYDEFHWREISKRNPRSEGRFPYPYKSEFLRHYWNHKTYEEALEYGLQEALKLIK